MKNAFIILFTAIKLNAERHAYRTQGAAKEIPISAVYAEPVKPEWPQPLAGTR